MKPLSLQEFQNPGPRPRLAPFWFWNCDMDEAKVRHQVQQMAEAGCGGFFIHPRQGLTLPYLSKAWFARVRTAVEAAKQWGLEVWLYDEYPYPSGIAGGLVTANHPEFRARVIKKAHFEAHGGELLRREFGLGRLVCALAYPVVNGSVNWEAAVDIREEIGVVLTREQFWYWPMGHIPTNEKRFMSDEGRLVLEWTPPAGEWQIFVGIESEQRGFKYYDCFLDPLVPGAVEEFIRLTHEPYAASLGEFFGNVIPGIFTDEIEPPAWSPEIEKSLGLDFSRLLPALYLEDHPQANKIRLQWRECALSLFQQRWENPIANWCRNHNLIWGAEKPTYRPSQFWNVAEPSTDAGHRRIPALPEPLTTDLRANARAAMAATEQKNGEEVRCECFHSLGWGATLQDQKWAVDWLCVQGVNRFTPHAFYATSAGLKKHDAAPSFFAENPYWPHFRLFTDYVGRLSLAMSSGREKARIALLHPTELLWGVGQSTQAVKVAYEKLQNDLLAEHYQFHIVDAEALLKAQLPDGGLEIGRARYEILIVPAIPNESPQIQAAIAKATEAGLTICHAETDTNFERFNAPSIRNENGDKLPNVWALWRETESQELLFFANTSGENLTAQVEVKSNVSQWQQWSLETGEITYYPARIEAENSRFSLYLPAYGSVLLVGGVHATQPLPEPLASPKPLTLLLDGDWELKLDRPNAVRLNRWRAAVVDHDWNTRNTFEDSWAEIEALPLRHLDQRRGKGWINLLERKAGETVGYQRQIDCEFVPENLEILIENGAIAGDWTLFVNGSEIPNDAFLHREYNGEDKTAASVASYFRKGTNLISLRVQNAPEMGGLLTPLHLLGDFALTGAGARILTQPPQKSPFNDLVAAGLPHYSGKVTYINALNLGDSQRIELPAGFAEIAEISVDGQYLGVRAWSPYQWNISSTDTTAPEPVEVEITITNTLLPFVEGQQWDTVKGIGHDV